MKGLKFWTIASFIIAMAILLIGGYFALDKVPPYPSTIKADGTTVSAKADILAGQDVYQKYGLMDHGSVWGHGTLRGMDFSATTLHLTGTAMREFYAHEKGTSYEALSADDRAAVDSRVVTEIKHNGFEKSSGTLPISPAVNYALQRVRDYWENEFGAGDQGYGFLPNTVKTAPERKAVADFFFWTAWAA